MAVDAITIHLPDGLYRRLERLASLTHQPLEGLIVKTLSSSLPPLPDDLPPATRDALMALESLNDNELQQVVQATLPDQQYERLTMLREQRRERILSANEQTDLDQLQQEADTLVLKKAYAAVLLKWRGQSPSPSPTPGSSETNA
ncbi:MAG TPA: hypothetical protein VF040_19030 [Ktedonobacterales bacterium]